MTIFGVISVVSGCVLVFSVGLVVGASIMRLAYDDTLVGSWDDDDGGAGGEGQAATKPTVELRTKTSSDGRGGYS